MFHQSSSLSAAGRVPSRYRSEPVLSSKPAGSQSRSGSSQEYMSRFYVGMRGAWNSGTADNLAGGEEFWQKLTEGAVSTAAPEG